MPALIRTLKDRDRFVALRVPGPCLIGPRAKSAVPGLIESLTDSDRSVRSHAVIALRGIGPDAGSAVPALATALGRIGPKAKAALPALKELLNDSNEGIVKAAAVAICAIEKR